MTSRFQNKLKYKLTTYCFVILCPLFLLSTSTHGSDSSNPVNFYHLPYLDTRVYSQWGDICIGDVANTADYNYLDEVCSTPLMMSSLVPESTEPIKFAVDLVNRDPDLLPNVTLGFHIRGGCETVGIKLAMSFSFLPRIDDKCNDTDRDGKSNSNSPWLTHDVIGLIAPRDSKEALPISALFSIAQVPVVAYEAGSYQLNDKELYPYFFRISTQDKFLVRAILRFLADHGWTYIQVVYRDLENGRDAYKFMYKLAPEYGICIARTYYMASSYHNIQNIVNHPRARVIVSFFKFGELRSHLQDVANRNVRNHFIWVCGSYMDGYNGYHYDGITEDPGIGTFIVYPSTTLNYEYYDHIRKLDIHITKNPWLKPIWEFLQNCSYDKRTCNPNIDILKTPDYIPFKSAMLRIDAVLTYAHAAHNLLRDICPNARGKEARACITGKLLMEYLRRVKFQGYNNFVEFNKNHDLVGNFTIRQLVYGYRNDTFGSDDRERFLENTIGIYSSLTDKIAYTDEKISWSHLKKVKRIAPFTNGSLSIEVPESICSRPCVPGEYKIVKNISCCWDCLRCRAYERLANGNTSCVRCPPFSWPDPASDNTTCANILPDYQTLKDTIPLLFFTCAVVAILIAIAIFSAYIYYRNERVIKASSKELSVIQLFAILLGYTTIILYQTRPSDVMCGTIFFTFSMSFAMLYSPLLVKTIRIFRIFKSGLKNEKPSFISPRSGLIFSIVLILVQIFLCSGTFRLYLPGAKKTQPDWSKKMVELSCDFTFPGLASFLGYNVVLVFLCAVVAFMVRGLPDNFNESKFISMCVSTTLLIWLAFIPTYFTSDKEYIRGFLLCIALLVNHSIALGILFAPKIYRAKFLSPNVGNFSNARS